MKSKELSLYEALKNVSEGYANAKLDPDEFARFKTALAKLFDNVAAGVGEGEENQKNVVAEFLKDAYYKDKHNINTKDKFKIDLVIHTGKSPQSPVSVIIETKNPANVAEMITADNLNAKALHQLVLYYFREKNSGNDEVTHLIATNVSEWFIFDAAVFKSLFYENTELVAYFEKHAAKKLDDNSTSAFYEHVERFVDENKPKIAFTHFKLEDYKNADEDSLVELYKTLSPEHLLKLPFRNDSNTINKKFYNELLYIIGLTEVGQNGKANGKTRIERCKEGKRQSGALLEETIVWLKATNKLEHVDNVERYGSTKEEQLFNVALELVITWINRILFLKLLEAQLLSYHHGDEAYSFLSHKKVTSYNDFDELFFQVLALQAHERDVDVREKFASVPYLNSTLFTLTRLERDTLSIGNLKNKPIQIFPQTVFNGQSDTKKKWTGRINSLEYLLAFLDAYDFGSEKKDKFQSQDRLINAAVLGLIFEKINGYKDGSHFTPGVITMYMCREAIRKAVVQKFNDKMGWSCKEFGELYNKIDDIEKANDVVNSLKICDPAVGSGHFLVSALNEIIAIKHDLKILRDSSGKRLKEYNIQIVNDELQLTERGKPFAYHPFDTESRRVQETLFHEKQTVIENCLFGVDINHNSVAICRLRLWIELLKSAYYKNATELETLPNIDINIKCGNSLVSRFSISDSMERMLENSKYTIAEYREAVATYRNAISKEQKLEMERRIETIKSDIRVWLLQLRLPSFEEDEKVARKIYENAFEWRFEFPEVLNDRGDFVGFDVVIGNPPYGFRNVLTPQEKVYFRRKRNIQFPSGDVAELFVIFSADKLTRPNGILSFIIPKKSLYGESWVNVRKLWLENSVKFLIDASQAFENVLLEQAAFAIQKVKLQQPNDIAVGWLNASISAVEVFGTFKLKDVFADDLRNAQIYKCLYPKTLLQKIKKLSVENTSGLILAEMGISSITPDLTLESKGNYPCVKGIDIKRYGLKPDIHYLKRGVAKQFMGDHQHDKLVAQRIIAHIQNPRPHILITMFFDDCKRLLSDTCVEIKTPRGKLDLKFLMGYFHSTFANWYAYNFVYNRAIRTMDFINYYVTQIAIPKSVVESPSSQKPIIKLVNRVLAAKKNDPNTDTTALESEIDRLVYELYGLTKPEIAIVEGRSG